MSKKAIHNCAGCRNHYCASKVPLFSTLNTYQLEVLSGFIRQKSYKTEEFILREGSDMESLIFIQKGQAKAYRNSYDGRELIFYIFSAGDFFGEKNILATNQATYNVKAIKKTEVCSIHKNDFQHVITQFPDIALKIIDALSKKIDKLEQTIDRGNRDVENRLQEVLLEFSNKYGETHSRGRLITLPVNREGIANYIGVSRETVSRKMSRMESDGIIEMIGNKKVLILNQDFLKERINH